MASVSFSLMGANITEEQSKLLDIGSGTFGVDIVVGELMLLVD